MIRTRAIQQVDAEAWSRMRTALWPDTPDEHRSEIAAFFTGDLENPATVFVAEHLQDHSRITLIGFVEVGLRQFVEGCEDPICPYVEGWYVDEAYRKQGIGRKLIEATEAWARLKGYGMLGSDAAIDNTISIEAHKQLGFKEVERVVMFLKKIDEP